MGQLSDYWSAPRQSANRSLRLLFAEYDADRHLLKVNPLADWDIDVIKAYVADNSACRSIRRMRAATRRSAASRVPAGIKPGEPERAGRWWWEQDQTRECGLHVAEEASAVTIAVESRRWWASCSSPSSACRHPPRWGEETSGERPSPSPTVVGTKTRATRPSPQRGEVPERQRGDEGPHGRRPVKTKTKSG